MKSNYLDHPDYSIYIENQRAETGGAGVDHKYLSYLVDTLLPDFDYSGARVLDVGAGMFKSFDYFLERFNNKIVGIEIAEMSIKYAEENNLPLYDIDAHLMDEYFAEKSMDLVVSLHSLEHMLDMPLVLSNCYKILRPEGYFFFALPIPVAQLAKHEGHWYPCDTPEEMVSLTTGAGFTMVTHFMSENDQFRAGSEFVGLASR